MQRQVTVQPVWRAMRDLSVLVAALVEIARELEADQPARRRELEADGA